MMVFGGQKSAKFVILSQNYPTMMGQKSQKIQHFGSNSEKKIKHTILWRPTIETGIVRSGYSS